MFCECVYDFLKRMGGHSYIVGGAVRDILMRKTPHDIDIVTDVPLDEIKKKFRTIDIGGERHGTVQVFDCSPEVADRNPNVEELPIPRYEVTEMRGAGLEDDIASRDFTVNCAFIDSDGNVIDPINAAADIKDKKLRMASPTSIQQDPLRALRGLRFAHTHGFTEVELNTVVAIGDMLGTMHEKIASPERIQQEFKKAIENMTLDDYRKFLFGTDGLGGAYLVIPELYRLPVERIEQIDGYVRDHAYRLREEGRIYPETMKTIKLYMTFGFLDDPKKIQEVMLRMRFSWGDINSVTELMADLRLYNAAMHWNIDMPKLVELYRRRGKDEIERVFRVLTNNPGVLPCASVCEFYINADEDPDFSEMLKEAGMVNGPGFGKALYEFKRRYYTGDTKFAPFRCPFPYLDDTARMVAEEFKQGG